jgi:hypothetical protein
MPLNISAGKRQKSAGRLFPDLTASGAFKKKDLIPARQQKLNAIRCPLNAIF